MRSSRSTDSNAVSQNIVDELTDAVADATRAVLDNIQNEWRREWQLIEAQKAQMLAEHRATIAELRQHVREEIAARMAVVKDGEPGRSVSVEDVAPMIRAEVDRAVAAIPAPEPASVDRSELLRMVHDEVVGAVDALYPREMFDAVQPDAIAAAIRTAVEAIPAPRDGKDADPAEIAAMVQGAVDRAVAALPPPEPGKSVTLDEVRPVVDEAVSAAVSALPPPEPGRDADPEEVRKMVAEAVGAIRLPEGVDADTVQSMVTAAVAALPPPEPGKSVDPEDVRAMVQDAVAALPPPERGEPGPPGKLPMVRAWADGVHYEADVVTHEGAVYQAQRDTGREPPHEDWLLIAAPGRDGEDGRSMTIRGTWSAADVYARLDVVALNGASFVARRDDPGPCPGEGWQMIAAQGKRGNPGEAGKGLRGEPGKAGPPVAAMSVDDDGMLTLVNADGSRVQCDLYPLLSRLGR